MKTTTAVIVIIVIVIIGYGIFNARQHGQSDVASTTDQSMNTESGRALEEEDWNINAAGLGILIVEAGSGPAAEVGDTVAVHYTGTLENGTVFDSSAGRAPIEFTLGTGAVIAGWEQGILGMQVGEKRRLNIPSELAYGATGAGGGRIPPNATLLFDVELVEIK